MASTPRPRPRQPMQRAFSPDNNDRDNDDIIDSSPPTTPIARYTHRSRASGPAVAVSSPFVAVEPPSPLSSPAADQLLRELEEQESKCVRIEVEDEAQHSKAEEGVVRGEDTDKQKAELEEEAELPNLEVKSEEQSRGLRPEESIQEKFEVFRKQLDVMMGYIGGIDSSQGEDKRLDELKRHLQAASSLLAEPSSHHQQHPENPTIDPHPASSPPHPTTHRTPPRIPLIHRSTAATTLPPSSLGKRPASPPSHGSKRTRTGPAPVLNSVNHTPTKRTSSSRELDGSPYPASPAILSTGVNDDEDRPGKRVRTGIAPNFDELNHPSKRSSDINAASATNHTLETSAFSNRPLKRTCTKPTLTPSATHLGKHHITSSAIPTTTLIPPAKTTGKRLKRTHNLTPKPQIIGRKRGRSPSPSSPSSEALQLLRPERRKEGRDKQKRVRGEYAQDGDPEVEYYEPGELLSSSDESESEDEDEETWLRGDDDDGVGDGGAGGGQAEQEERGVLASDV